MKRVDINFKLDMELCYCLLFYSSILVAFVGIGYVLPFFLGMLFLIFRYRKKFISLSIVKSAWNFIPLRFLIFSWAFLFVLSFISDFVVNSGKSSGDEGIFSILAWAIFFVLGYISSFSVSFKKTLKFYMRSLIGAYIIVFAFFYGVPFIFSQPYLHGAFKNINILTSLVLILISATLGILWDKNYSKLERGILLTFAVMAILFCFFSATSDMSIPLLFLSIFILSVIIGSKKIDLYWAIFLVTVGVISFFLKDPISMVLKDLNLIGWPFWKSFFNHRDEVWSFSIWMLAKSPLWGIGTGNFTEIYQALLMEKGLSGSLKHYNHSHMIFLHQAVIHGIFAFLAYIGMVFFVLRGVVFAIKNEFTSHLGTSIFGIWLCFCIYGLVENAVGFRELIPFIWGSTGVLFGVIARLDTSK